MSTFSPIVEVVETLRAVTVEERATMRGRILAREEIMRAVAIVVGQEGKDKIHSQR